MLLQVAGIDAEQMAKELHAVVEPMQRYDIHSLTIYYDLSTSLKVTTPNTYLSRLV